MIRPTLNSVAIVSVMAIVGLGDATSVDAQIDRHIYTQKYIACLHAQTVDLDDGHSNVASIGHAITPLCRAPLEAYVRIKMAENPRLSQTELMSQLKSDEDSRATAVVIQRRSTVLRTKR